MFLNSLEVWNLNSESLMEQTAEKLVFNCFIVLKKGLSLNTRVPFLNS